MSAGLYIHIYVMWKCFSWGKRPEREPDGTRPNAETECLAPARMSVSLCVFGASCQINMGEISHSVSAVRKWAQSGCPLTCRLQSHIYLVSIYVCLRPGFIHRYARRAVERVERKERLCC